VYGMCEVTYGMILSTRKLNVKLIEPSKSNIPPGL
jgi:hypothetical protein